MREIFSFTDFYLKNKPVAMICICSLTSLIILISCTFLVYLKPCNALKRKITRRYSFETNNNTILMEMSADNVDITKREKEKLTQECLDAHNYYRMLHNVQPLKLSSKLNEAAQEWADHLASNNIFEHKQPNPYGENLYKRTSTKPIIGFTLNGRDVVEALYSKELKMYRFDNPEADILKTGHFTQIVWADTKYVGVGVTKSPKKTTIYVVCEYDPPGNYVGLFHKNVFPPNLDNIKERIGSSTVNKTKTMKIYGLKRN